MTFDAGERLTPAQVAELLAIPASTLRTYATEFGRLLSAEARGDPAVAGRAFRHRRYTHDDLAVLGRAKALLDSGLSYRLARAQLTGDSVLNIGDASVVDARRSRVRGPAREARAAARPAPSPRRSTIPAAPPSPNATPTELPPPRIERVVETIVDARAAAAVERLTPLVERVVADLEALRERAGRIEDQLEALRIEVRRLDRPVVAPEPQRPWLRRILGI